MANSVIRIRAGDTEPLEFTISASQAGTAIPNLDDVAEVVFYAQKRGAATAHVDGASASVASSPDRRITFDPVGAKNGGGNAFDAEGQYLCYALVTWTDGDTTRHPGGSDLVVDVRTNYE